MNQNPFYDNAFESSSEREEGEEPLSLVPKRALDVAEPNAYAIYADPRLHCIYIETKEYHPGTLVIKKEGLAALVDNAFPSKQEGIVFLTELIRTIATKQVRT